MPLRSVSTRHTLLCMLMALGTLLCLPAQANKMAAEAAITIGQRFNMKSEVLGEDRKLLIHLPKDYERSKQRYPVLFILDGGAHFDYTIGLVDFLTRNERTPELILVAVPSMQKRTRDMLPGQGAEKFLRFLADELTSWVDANYRTQPFRIFSGHSLGGKFSFYALLERPDAFQAYIVPSPSLYSSTSEFQQTKERISKLPGKHWLYFSSGDYDSLDDHEYRTLDGVQRLTTWMKRREFDNLEWASRYYPGDTHGTTPLRTLYDGLQWLYKDWRVLSSQDFGLEEVHEVQHKTSEDANKAWQKLKELSYAELERRITTHYARISRIYGYTVEPGYDGSIWKRNWLSIHERYDEAEVNARTTLAAYPERSAWLHETISVLLEKQGRTVEALAEYRKALREHERFPDPWWSEFGDDRERERRLKTLEKRAAQQKGS